MADREPERREVRGERRARRAGAAGDEAAALVESRDAGKPAKVQGDTPFTHVVDITGRTFGIAAQMAPALGKDVILTVMRSET